ncbi:MAG TPA: MFS transporter [Bryobacteraceae bacterium]
MSTNPTEVPPNSLSDRQAREWAGGFLLLGVLLGLLGPLIIAWQYHIDVDPQLIGLHFLALNAGYVIAVAGARTALVRISLRSLTLVSCALALAALLALSFFAPPVSVGWRMLGLGLVGVSAGALASALLYSLEPHFVKAPAAAANYAGVLFGCGCLVATVMVGMTYFAGSIRIETALLAVVPLIFGIVYAGSKYPEARKPVPARKQDPLRETLKDLRSIAAVLFSLLLFVQFGNEWAIAGWLPLFLIRRLGTNPVWAIFALALYFFTLMAARLAAQKLLVRWSHRRLLLGGMLAAVGGFLLLSLTGSFALACLAVVIIGCGFAPVYPIIAETLDERFSYHPGFYNGTFSLAITGAMSSPWLLGYVEALLGARWVMLLPAVGSIVTVILALLIKLEAHVMGGSKAPRSERAMEAASGR